MASEIFDDKPGGIAGVFVPMVQEMEMRTQLGEAAILGAALAHEIGHLLGAGNAATGVMSARILRSASAGNGLPEAR